MTRHILVLKSNEYMGHDFKNIPALPKKVQCVVTSPPYRDTDGYSLENIRTVARILEDVLDGWMWLNFGDLAGQMDRAPSTAAAFEMEGFNWHQTIVWLKSINGKGQYTPFPETTARFNTLHEYLYLMYPQRLGVAPKLDRLAIGVPYTDKANIARFKHAQDLRCPGTAWHMPYTTVQSKTEKRHEHRFPVELPVRCIKASALKEGDWVLDPWAGGATTAWAAKFLGLNSISYEIDKSLVKVFEERLGEVEVIE